MVPRRYRRLAEVGWVEDLPDTTHHWEFSVLISDPGVAVPRVPGRNSGAIGVGSFELPNQSTVWVVRKLEELSDDFASVIEWTAQGAANGLTSVEDRTVRRGHMIGETDAGVRCFADVAVNCGFADSELEAALTARSI